MKYKMIYEDGVGMDGDTVGLCSYSSNTTARVVVETQVWRSSFSDFEGL